MVTLRQASIFPHSGLLTQHSYATQSQIREYGILSIQLDDQGEYLRLLLKMALNVWPDHYFADDW